jgi:hypothetical protein
MPPLFPGVSRHLEFIRASRNRPRIMFERMSDPSGIIAIRLVIVRIQLLLRAEVPMFGPRCRD